MTWMRSGHPGFTFEAGVAETARSRDPLGLVPYGSLGK